MVKGLGDDTEEGTLLDIFKQFGQVREIRLVRERLTKLSRGFAFIEYHALESAQAAVDAGGKVLIDGVSPRITFARDVKDSYGSGGRVSEGGGANSGYEHAQQAGSAHQGPKRSGFGIPSGFLPDQASGMYYSAESGYYFDADRKLYFHPTTMLWRAHAAPTRTHRAHRATAHRATLTSRIARIAPPRARITPRICDGGGLVCAAVWQV